MLTMCRAIPASNACLALFFVLGTIQRSESARAASPDGASSRITIPVKILSRTLTLATATLRVAPLPEIDPVTCSLLVWCDAGPIGWFTPIPSRFDGDSWSYSGTCENVSAQEFAACNAVLVSTQPDLPKCEAVGTPLFTATITAIAPGNQSVWLNVGRRNGVKVGDEWLLELGQPAARFETVFVDETRCAALVVPLVSDLPLSVNDSVALWPSPADRRAGKLQSAIAYIDRTETDTRFWVPLPSSAIVPEGTHVELARSGIVIALGILEKRSTPFSIIRLVAEIPGSSESANSAKSPANGPVIGDRVHFRTPADIRARDYAPRVFSRSGDKFLINAGEPESLKVGDTLKMFRNSQAVGVANVDRVQRTYATIRPVENAALQIGDVALMGDAPAVAPGENLGVIEAFTAIRDVIMVRLAASETFAAHDFFVVFQEDAPVGAVQLVAQTSKGCIAVIIDASKAHPLRIGDSLRRAVR
ncbi:MAG: hypothetical protein AB7N71_10320 [Phycisphaerae bacterium]